MRRFAACFAGQQLLRRPRAVVPLSLLCRVRPYCENFNGIDAKVVDADATPGDDVAEAPEQAIEAQAEEVTPDEPGAEEAVAAEGEEVSEPEAEGEVEPVDDTRPPEASDDIEEAGEGADTVAANGNKLEEGEVKARHPHEIHAKAAAVQMTEDEIRETCLLCDQEVTNWIAHVNETSHIARHTVCSALISSDKHSEMMQQLWNSIHLDFKLIKEFNLQKTTKRRHRLGSTLRYLRDHNVLLHSIVRYHRGREEWGVTQHFDRLCFIGDGVLRNEVGDRLARLFPMAGVVELVALRDHVLSRDNLCTMFDLLELNAVLERVYRRNSKPSKELKVKMLMAITGELHWFVVKTRATDRTHNNALFPPSDALVLHVLSTHGLENIISEVVHHVIQRVVDDVTPIWKVYQRTLPVIAGSHVASAAHSNRGSKGKFQPPLKEEKSQPATVNAGGEILPEYKSTGLSFSVGEVKKFGMLGKVRSKPKLRFDALRAVCEPNERDTANDKVVLAEALKKAEEHVAESERQDAERDRQREEEERTKQAGRKVKQQHQKPVHKGTTTIFLRRHTPTLSKTKTAAPRLTPSVVVPAISLTKP